MKAGSVMLSVCCNIPSFTCFLRPLLRIYVGAVTLRCCTSPCLIRELASNEINACSIAGRLVVINIMEQGALSPTKWSDHHVLQIIAYMAAAAARKREKSASVFNQ